MKVNLLYLLLALIPTTTLVSKSDFPNQYLEGFWSDYRSDLQFEIKYHRKGIKVRRLNNYNRSKWNVYYNRGRGFFDDCDGRVIIVLGRGVIEWKNGRHRKVVLEKYKRSDRLRRNYGSSRQLNYNQSYNFSGKWYCPEFGLNLEIERYRDGFRARRPKGSWTQYYSNGDGVYSDRRGNRYKLNSNKLSWESNDGRRKFKFNRSG